MLHVNAYNTLPIFITVSMILGEPSNISSSLPALDTSFLMVFGLLILSGCILTYSQFLCAAVCSALTTSMIGVAKSVIQTILGFFTFGGVKFHPLNIIGTKSNFLSSLCFLLTFICLFPLPLLCLSSKYIISRRKQSS